LAGLICLAVAGGVRCLDSEPEEKPANPKPAARRPPPLRPRSGIWRAKNQGEIDLSFQVTRDRKHLKSILVSGKGYRFGEFEAYGVTFYGRMPLDGTTFKESGEGCTISGQFVSETEARGQVSLTDPKRPAASFSNPWVAKWECPLKR